MRRFRSSLRFWRFSLDDISVYDCFFVMQRRRRCRSACSGRRILIIAVHWNGLSNMIHHSVDKNHKLKSWFIMVAKSVWKCCWCSRWEPWCLDKGRCSSVKLIIIAFDPDSSDPTVESWIAVHYCGRQQAYIGAWSTLLAKLMSTGSELLSPSCYAFVKRNKPALPKDEKAQMILFWVEQIWKATLQSRLSVQLIK